MFRDSNNPKVLTVAGSDSSCGAGIQADIVTLKAFSVVPLCAVTAITSQTEERFLDSTNVPPNILASQLAAAAACGPIGAVKVGMLGSSSNVRELILFLKGLRCANVVIDPVLSSSSGADLLEVSAHSVFKEGLLPLASVVTPNAIEAGLLAGLNVWNVATMKEAAKTIWNDVVANRYDGGASPFHVLVKGGHLQGSSVDVLFNGSDFVEFDAPRILTSEGKNASRRGTGCRLSSALAAGIASGMSVTEAARAAKQYVAAYLAGADGI